MKKPTQTFSFDLPLEPIPLTAPAPGYDVLFTKNEIVSLRDLPDDKTGPVLDVTNGHGGPDRFAFHHVLAVMLFPQDEATRREFLSVVEKARIWSKTDPTRLRPTGAVTNLIQAVVMDNRWAGITAGRVLWWMLWLAHQHPPGSVNKAVFLVVQEKKRYESLWSGPTSRERILEAWKCYKPVAHLWATLGGYFAEQQTLSSVFAADTIGQFSNLRSLFA